jgi:hypothetical protein
MRLPVDATPRSMQTRPRLLQLYRGTFAIHVVTSRLSSAQRLLPTISLSCVFFLYANITIILQDYPSRTTIDAGPHQLSLSIAHGYSIIHSPYRKGARSKDDHSSASS